MPPSNPQTCSGAEEQTLDTLADSEFAKDPLSDFIVICGKKKFHVHRVVLRRAPYFAPIINGEWMESKERKLNLSHDDPVLVFALLAHIYGQCYHTIRSRVVMSSNGPDLEEFVGLQHRSHLLRANGQEQERVTLLVPRREILHHLLHQANQMWESLPNADWNMESLANPGYQQSLAAFRVELMAKDLQLYILGERYGQLSLKAAARDFIKCNSRAWESPDVLEVIRTALKSLPEDDKLVSDNLASELAKRVDLMENVSGKSLLREFSDFALQVLESMAKRMAVASRMMCPGCDQSLHCMRCHLNTGTLRHWETGSIGRHPGQNPRQADFTLGSTIMGRQDFFGVNSSAHQQ